MMYEDANITSGDFTHSRTIGYYFDSNSYAICAHSASADRAEHGATIDYHPFAFSSS